MKFSNIVTLLFTAASSFCFAQQASFHHKRKLDAITQAGWYTITLPPDIFAHTQREFSDLRLFSFEGKDTTEIPYVLTIRETETEKTEIDLPVINQSKKGGILFLGFELSPGQKVNYIDLAFEESNFFGIVKIEGSQDKKEWFEIADEERIFSIQNNYEQYENGVVSFPLTDYRHLRVSVKSDTPLKFQRASFINQEVREGTFENIPLVWKKEDDKKAKQTVVTVKLEHYRPISNLTIEFADDRDFYRSANIAYLTDSLQTQKGWIKNYTPAYSGYVTSFYANTFDLGFLLTNEVRLIIYNYDNAPLTIKSITASGAAVELKASLTPQDTYLFYGNPVESRPSYDIDYFKAKIPALAPGIGLGPEENIAASDVKVEALFENKFWLWAIMLTVIAVLGFFTLRMMKGKAEVQS